MIFDFFGNLINVKRILSLSKPVIYTESYGVCYVLLRIMFEGNNNESWFKVYLKDCEKGKPPARGSSCDECYVLKNSHGSITLMSCCPSLPNFRFDNYNTESVEGTVVGDRVMPVFNELLIAYKSYNI